MTSECQTRASVFLWQPGLSRNEETNLLPGIFVGQVLEGLIFYAAENAVSEGPKGSLLYPAWLGIQTSQRVWWQDVVCAECVALAAAVGAAVIIA